MQANDRTLAHYLYDNRISPPPEFSERIDAFCGSLAQREGHTNHPQCKARTGNKTRRARRWLMPLVAGLVVLAVVFSIPSVSRAVGDWIASIFRSEDYMAVKPDQREVNSDLADAVQTPMPTDVKATIRFLDETEYLDGANQWRKENGYAAFDRGEYAWVNELAPRVNELFYDGRQLIINTTLTASPKRFIGTYGGAGERFDLWTNSVSVQAGGQPYPNFTEEGGGLRLDSLARTDGADGFDMDAVNAASSVTLLTTLVGKQAPAFPSGRVTVTLEQWLMDGRIDDMNPIGLVAIITQTVTFDATEGNGKLGSTNSVTKRLTGTVPITINWEDGAVENKMFDLSTVSVTATIARRTTGIGVALHYTFDDEALEQAYWNAIVPGATGGHGLQYEAIVNGRSIGKVWDTGSHLDLREDPVIELPFTESELANVPFITLRPWIRYMDAYSTDGEMYETMPLDKKLYLNSFHDDYLEAALKACDIVIPLS